jgi:hypothetical protein
MLRRCPCIWAIGTSQILSLISPAVHLCMAQDTSCSRPLRILTLMICAGGLHRKRRTIYGYSKSSGKWIYIACTFNAVITLFNIHSVLNVAFDEAHVGAKSDMLLCIKNAE